MVMPDSIIRQELWLYFKHYRNAWYLSATLAIPLFLLISLSGKGPVPPPPTHTNESIAYEVDFVQLKSCTDDRHCDSASICFHGKCQCEFGREWNNETSSCVPFNCTTDLACTARYVHSRCITEESRCDCEQYYSMTDEDSKLKRCEPNYIWFMSNCYTLMISLASSTACWLLFACCIILACVIFEVDESLDNSQKAKTNTGLEDGKANENPA